jgi:regulatory protein
VAGDEAPGTGAEPAPGTEAEPAPGTEAEPGLDPERRLQHALDLAYRHLGRRARTEAELRGHLEDRLVEPDTIEDALAELERAGYLDDADYARRFAEDRRTLDSWGPERIERRLLELGVEPGLVARAVASRDPGEERAAAVAILARRFPVPLVSERDRARALGVLVRKGYDLESAHDAIRAYARDDVTI